MASRILFVLALTVSVPSAALAIGTAFTYQGRLSDAGSPAEGPYDFEFRLFDAPSAGNLIALQAQEDVPVGGGLFTATLDFGDVFDGNDRWLEIGVRPGASTGAYTTLAPRQPLTATPYALRSRSASTADSATTATTADSATTAADLGCVGCVTGGELDFDPATQAELDTHKASGDHDPRYVLKAGDTMTGTLNLPANGLAVGTGQLVTAAGNVGVGTTTPASRLEVAGDLIRTLTRVHGYASDATDNGPLAARLVTFTKKATDTGLRVTYTDNFRVLTTNSAGRWEVRFNGVACPNPGGLFYDLYNSQQSAFMHIPVTVTGTCFGLGPGNHTVQVYVGPTPGYPVNDLWTGWNNQYFALEVEEVR